MAHPDDVEQEVPGATARCITFAAEAQESGTCRVKYEATAIVAFYFIFMYFYQRSG